MLKHVQISPMRNRADSLSLRSSTASSCASSMCGSPEPPTELQRTPSRASSYSSLNEQLPQTTIKVYTNCLKIDIEYKTLGIQWDTTSKEVISQLLRRLKMRHRDPRLFYLSMEVSVRRAGVKTILVLDDDTRPAILQACHPKGESRFCLQLRPGGLIRVHTSALQPSSQYKSLVISEETTSDELLHLLLGCYSSPEPVEQFSIYEVCPGQEYQRKLHPDDIPLRAQAERMKRGETCHFLVRRNPNYARRRQLLANLNEAMHKSYDTHSMHSTSLEDIDENSLLDLSIESLSDDLHSLAMLTSDEDEDCASSASSSGSSDTSTECATISNTTKTVTLRQATNKLITNVAAAAAAAGQGNNTNAMSATATATSPSLSLSAKASTICLKCRNNFKSCEFCQQNSALIAAQTLNQQQQQHATAKAKTCNAQSPPRGYSPVYNIREIRTATHSFSALGKDKKLLDIHLNARFDAACRIQRPQSLYLGTSCNSHMSADANGNGGGVSTATPMAMAATDVNGNATSNVAAGTMLATTTVAGEAVNNNPAKGLGHFVYL